jgi:DNA-binding NarL/FixJ family response regulator/predicted negative regulator of RcsB-dependent stress response
MRSMADRWPLTGRGEELRVINEALADEDHPGMVLTGLAGVGKTRLARAAADAAAREGWSVRRIAGTVTGRPVTLGAFARWIDDASTSPLTLARKVFAGLAADTPDAPLLLFVDDAHLLDDMSALIVHQLVLQGAARVIATSRTGQPAPDAVTALWKDGLLRRLELQPLSRDESSTLLSTVLGGPVSVDCAKRMWNLSRGNVLFLHHLVEEERDAGRLAQAANEWRWTGTPSASSTLVELVELQIGAVPEDVRDVVDIVAITEPVDRALLIALTDSVAVEAAEQRGLIQAGTTGDVVYVGHPLYGEIRLSQCGPTRLRRLRGRVATAMAQSDALDPLRLGLLWLESDLPPDAELLTMAANLAAYRLDVDTAERLARAAVDAKPEPVTKLLLAYILFMQEKGRAAEEILDTLDGQEFIAPGFVDGVVLRAANLLWPLHDPEAARVVLEDALALGDEERNHSLRTFLAIVQATAAAPAEAIATMGEVDYDRLDAYGRVMGYSAETIALGDMGRMAQAGDRASAAYRVLAESPTDSFQGSGVEEFHAFALLAAGCVDEAAVVTERYHREWAELPGINQSMALGAQGMAALAKGDLVGALRHLHSALESFGDYGEISGLLYRFRIAYAETLARSGDVDAAVTMFDVATGGRHPAYGYVESAYLMIAAWVSAVQGRVAEARENACRAAEFARSRGQLAREVLSLQAAVQFGDVTIADRLAELATEVEGPRAPLAARYARALADDDAAELDAVSKDFEAMGDMLTAADAAAQAGASHRLAGRRGSALTASARAHVLAKNCGGAVSPALRAARVPLPFTRREHEIATLVSDGLTNKEIADATTLSVRTVEGHVYQASAKAGVASRSELSALVQQFNALTSARE